MDLRAELPVPGNAATTSLHAAEPGTRGSAGRMGHRLRAAVHGDRPSTDGELARALGARFALVLSGATGERDLEALRPPPDATAPDLGALVG